MTKLKAFANVKLNIPTVVIFLLDNEENTVGKGENAASIFSISYSVFQSFFLYGR